VNLQYIEDTSLLETIFYLFIFISSPLLVNIASVFPSYDAV
jgi:hypothetical protein